MVNPIEWLGQEWEDNPRVYQTFGLLSFLLVLFLMWVIVNIPEEASRATIFLFLLIVGITVGLVDNISDKLRMWEVGSFLYMGKNFKTAIFALIAGAVVGLLLMQRGFSFGTVAPSIFSASLMGFIYVGIVAPYVEEKFFRMATYPTGVTMLESVFNNRSAGVIGSLLLTSGAFGFMHYLAYNADVAGMMAAFMFSVIAIIGNRVCSSVGFGLGAHFTINILVLLSGGALV